MSGGFEVEEITPCVHELQLMPHEQEPNQQPGEVMLSSENLTTVTAKRI